ncbi:MAG: hypothetical protein U0359_23340 [Byssovorax sp.]
MVTRSRFNPPSGALRPALPGAAALLLALGATAIACSSSSSGTTGTGGGSTSTATTTATTTSGAGGAGGGCATDCDDKNPCTDDACNGGMCEHTNNDDLMPGDGNPCTKDVCKDGVESHPNEAAGVSCAANKICDANGMCQCTKDFQCGAPTSCVKPTCDPGVGCTMVMSTDVLPDPMAGDCKGVKCDGMGNETPFDDDADKPADDGNPCTDEVCMTGMGSHPPSAAGTACGGGKMCDGAGVCK